MPVLHHEIVSNLPIKYEQDYIALLARDPHWLYVYWDISENKKNTFFDEFGSEIINKSVPVLKITNLTKNESFYVRINDFSNNWYINVSGSNSIYMVEIGRRISDNFFISILNSNSTVTPGDSVSHDSTAYFVNYNDLKHGRLDLGMVKKFESQVQNKLFAGYIGISSQEFAGQSGKESHFGESSAQFYGI